MKNKRQSEILSIIAQKVVNTQEDLQNELLALGYNVTQSTVSRDIKELRLIKSHDSEGNYRYVSAAKKSSNDTSHYHDLFVKSVKSVDYALNNIVIKTHPGMASTACVALDDMFGDMMLGSLAGDDTIIIVTRSEIHSKILIDKINNIL
ncbi:MAG: arginine repressor [Clostridia bacterium]|nr:arginine repressor [Clostridia bacterium]